MKPAAEGDLQEKPRLKRNQNKETDPKEPKPKKTKTQPPGGGDDARAALLQKIQDAAKADEAGADEEADADEG